MSQNEEKNLSIERFRNDIADKIFVDKSIMKVVSYN